MQNANAVIFLISTKGSVHFRDLCAFSLLSSDAGHVDFILRLNQFFIILIISSDNHSEDVR